MNSTNDIFQGLSILLLSEDDARGKALAKALRDQRARVGEMGVSVREGARGVDLAVVDARSEKSLASQLGALHLDVRGRWASIVSIDYTSLVKGDGSVLLGGLAERIAPLIEADHALTARAREEENFKTSLKPLGPPRTLRALSVSGHTLFVELRAKTLEAVVEVSNDLLVSAAATRGDKRWEAWSALVRILGLSECEITVSRRAFTSFMNIMEPVDQALEVAAQERACAIHQIEREEAEAEARANAGQRPRAAAAPSMPAAATVPVPPPTPAAQPQPTAPRPAPPGRPMGSLGPQRTLMGIVAGLPMPGIAANDVRAIVAKPPAPPPPTPPEVPRYAHRQGAQGTAPKASMTLMGVAPSAIPGLAEQLRGQRPAEPAPAAVADPRAAQREALKEALSDQADFDPPTVRHNSLPDLTAAMSDLSDDLSSAAHPLSSPLPPPPSEDESERELRPGMTFDDIDEEDQTMITPSHLAEELLAQAIEGAATERPPPAAGSSPSEPVTVPEAPLIVDIRPSAVESLPTSEPSTPSERSKRSAEAEPARAAEMFPTRSGSDSTPAPSERSDPNIGEETLVVQRAPDKRSRTGLVGAIAVLAAVFGLVSYAALRSRPPESVPAPAAVVEPFAAPKAAEQPVAPPSEVEPANNALVPLAAGEAPATAADAGVAADNAGKVEAPIEQAPIEQAPNVPVPIEQTPSEKAPIEAAPAKSGEQAAPGAALPSGAGEQGAEQTADKAAPSAGDELNELLKKGQRLIAQRDAASARPVLEQALQMQPDNPHVRASLAQALLKLNELPLALVHAQTATKLRPKRGLYFVIQGNVLAAMGRADDAHAAFVHAYELDPNDVEAKRKAGL